VKIDDTGRGYYITRSHVSLPIKKCPNCPQEMLETLFWLRWAGSFESEELRESVILVGPTGYKTEAFHFLLSNFKERSLSLSRETQVSELMGSCVLRSPTSSNFDILSIQFEVKNKIENADIELEKNEIDEMIEEITYLKKKLSNNKRDLLNGALFFLYGIFDLSYLILSNI
jgi:hypothetical protein